MCPLCYKSVAVNNKFAWKKQNFITRVHGQQISNQIDAAAV